VKRLLVFATVVALSLVTSGMLLAQSNPQLGTWKLNVAKSKYVGTQAPKSQTRTYEAQGDAVKVSRDGIAGDGSRINYTNTSKYDGTDSPISGMGAPNGADTIANKRIDSDTITYTLKKAGKVVQTGRIVVSKDGKVMTIISKGTNAQGQPTSSTAVYDKQ
jgi:hypothetical protein